MTTYSATYSPTYGSSTTFAIRHTSPLPDSTHTTALPDSTHTTKLRGTIQ